MFRYRQRGRSGQSTVELALIIALVAAIALLALSATGVRLDQLFCRVVGIFGGSCGALFADDFSDLDDWQAVSGKWDNVDGELCGGPGEGKIFAPISADDYTINLDTARLTQGNGYGVFFRAQDVEQVDGYVFQYDPGMSGFVIRKWVSGREVWAPLAYKQITGYDWHGEDRKLQLAVEGDTFTVTLDGQPIMTTTDSTYAEGAVGMRTWDNSRACFDDLTINAGR